MKTDEQALFKRSLTLVRNQILSQDHPKSLRIWLPSLVCAVRFSFWMGDQFVRVASRKAREIRCVFDQKVKIDALARSAGAR